MPIEGPDDFEALRRRITVLEAMLETILGADLPWSRLDYRFASSRKPYEDSLRSGLPEEMYELVERYHHRRERVFLLTLEQIDDVRSAQRDTSRELANLGKVTADQANQTKQDLASLEARVQSGAAELHQWLAIQTLGLIEQESRVTRFLPMRAYLSDIPANGLSAFTEAIDNLIETFGFEVSDEFPEICGSWFKKWFVRTKEVASQPEVADRLAKIERALEMKGLATPQAEIDSKQASAVAALTTSLANVPTAAIQVGSILYLKLTIDDQAVVQARTLTQRELIVLENNQDLLNSPTTILIQLAEFCSKEAHSFDGAAAVRPSRSLNAAPDIWAGAQPDGGKKHPSAHLPAIPSLPYSGGAARNLTDGDELK